MAEGPTGAVMIADTGEDLLPSALARCFLSGLVGLHTCPPGFAAEPAERPVASPLARLQVERGSEKVASLRHRSITLRDFDRSVLAMLDGRHDRPALVDRLIEMAIADKFTIIQDDQPVRDPAVLRELFADEIEPSLRRIADHALLIDDI